MGEVSRTKLLAFAAVMAALSNILSIELFVIPFIIGPFRSEIHFTQIPLFVSGVLAGPWAGLLTGVVGGLYMSYSVGIPFIVGGLAILGFFTGFFARRLRLRPFLSSVLAWCVQAPYVFVTDYVWFVYTKLMPSSAALTVVATIVMKLTAEAIIASVLAEVLVHCIKRTGLIGG